MECRHRLAIEVITALSLPPSLPGTRVWLLRQLSFKLGRGRLLITQCRCGFTLRASAPGIARPHFVRRIAESLAKGTAEIRGAAKSHAVSASNPMCTRPSDLSKASCTRVSRCSLTYCTTPPCGVKRRYSVALEIRR